MRRVDKFKYIHEANRLAEQRYIASRPERMLESKQTEALGLKYLGAAQNAHEIIAAFAKGDKSKNQNNIPYMAKFYAEGYTDIEALISIFNEYNELFVAQKIGPLAPNAKGVKVGDKVFEHPIKFSEYIHGIKTLYAPKRNNQATETYVAEDKPIWSGNNIDIYDADHVSKCIKYTQGGLTGRGYTFCIGQPGNTMYQSYRDNAVSTFYFIVDRNRFKTNADGTVDLSDPLHIVVFDAKHYDEIELTDANNTTGTIAEFGEDANGYVAYLKSKGVPVEKLINRPKSDEEKAEDSALGKAIDSLEGFTRLSYDYKTKYIGRGHLLTDEQFDYILPNKELVRQYLTTTGREIGEYQFSKLNDNLKKSYLRSRMIAAGQGDGEWEMRAYEVAYAPVDMRPELIDKYLKGSDDDEEYYADDPDFHYDYGGISRRAKNLIKMAKRPGSTIIEELMRNEYFVQRLSKDAIGNMLLSSADAPRTAQALGQHAQKWLALQKSSESVVKTIQYSQDPEGLLKLFGERGEVAVASLKDSNKIWDWAMSLNPDEMFKIFVARGGDDWLRKQDPTGLYNIVHNAHNKKAVHDVLRRYGFGKEVDELVDGWNYY